MDPVDAQPVECEAVSPGPGPGASSAEPKLVALRTWARRVLLVHRGSWVIAGLSAVLIGAALVDFFLRTPGWMRGAALVLGVLTLAGVFWRQVWPAWRFGPSLEDLALRVEQTQAGREAGLGGVLASGVGLAAAAREGGSVAGVMARRVTDEAASRASRLSPLSVLDVRRALLAAGACLGVLMAAGALTVWRPTLSTIAAQRLLMPWAGVQWPKRTKVEDATAQHAHAMGRALAIRAGLVRSPQSKDSAQIEARYRVITGTKAGPEQVMVLNPQSEDVRVKTTNLDGLPIEADVPQFAQDIPAEALRVQGPEASGDAQLEYRLVSGDDETPTRRIRLVAPPGVTGASATITPPAYVPAPAQKLDLGAGVDERSTASNVLAGSRVELSLQLSKAVPAPSGPERGAWLARTLGAELPADAEVSTAQTGWTVRFTAQKPVRLTVRLTDEFGIDSAEDAVYRVQTVSDNPPEATVTVPDGVIDVLPDARVDLAVEARDDLGLESLAAQWQLARRPIGSTGAAPAPTGEPADLKRETLTGVGGREAPTTRLTVTTSIVPRDLAAQPGDEILITALAADIYRSPEGEARPAVRSPVRRIRIIGADDLIDQIWAELQGVRRSAIRTLEQQAGARERSAKAAGEEADTSRAQDLEGAAREQTQVQQTLSRMREAVAGAQRRMDQNGLNDAPLREAMEAAKRLAGEAQAAGEEASRKLDEARREAQKAADAQNDPAQRDQAKREARESAGAAERQQQTAERSLEELARKLDRGQDTWAVRRTLERLLQEQRGVREQVEAQAKQSTGQSRQDQTPQQREAGEQAARQQDQLARKAQEAVQQLQDSAKQMQKSDQATASALQEAARRAQRNQLSQQMEQAAQQVRENQPEQAGQSQQRAEQTLQQMLNDVQNAANQRDAVLRRQLDSLVESIRALIARQRTALANLDARRGNLDTELMTLSGATLSAADQARGAGPDAVPIARSLSAAAEAQDEAIGLLRATTVDFAATRAAEQRSLEKLEAALKDAQKAQQKSQQREEAAKRRQLREAYQALLAEQRLITTATKELVGKTVDRRVRFVAADLAARQTAMATKAGEALKTFPDLTKSPTFPIAHTRIEEAATAAAAKLSSAEVTAGVVIRQESIARTLEGLLAALKDPDNNEAFRSPEEGGQQGNSGGGNQPEGLIPSAAELELLKALQTEALTVTKLAADANDASLAAQAREDAAKLQAQLPAIAAEIVKKLQGGGDEPGSNNQEGGN